MDACQMTSDIMDDEKMPCKKSLCTFCTICTIADESAESANSAMQKNLFNHLSLGVEDV